MTFKQAAIISSMADWENAQGHGGDRKSSANVSTCTLQTQVGEQGFSGRLGRHEDHQER